MCRVLVYAGEALALDELLFKTNNSLVQQTYNPKQLSMLNLGGFGLSAWNPTSRNPEAPFVYHSTTLPNFDANLKSLAGKIDVSCLLAHVRGIPYTSDEAFGPQNLHPFGYAGCSWSMAHNGELVDFARIRHELLSHVKPEIAVKMRGTTDSEAIYALVMSQLDEPSRDGDTAQLTDAIVRALRIIRQVRKAHDIDVSSSANLFFSNGRDCVALRFVFDFGCYPVGDAAHGHVFATHTQYLSLWYTVGEQFEQVDGQWRMTGDPRSARSVLVASEPLTLDLTGWVEVPEYTFLIARRSEDGFWIETLPVDV